LSLSTLRAAGLVLVLACARGPGGEAPAPAAAQDPVPTRPLGLTAIAGQAIPVLPLTLVVSDPELAEDTVYRGWRDRLTALRTADTIIGDALNARGPEVQWILPPELRKIARRAPGMVGDPDQLGQAMMRDPKLERLPDNFRQNIRGLVAVAGNRYVLIPAALGFGRAADGRVQADLSLVLADVRNGVVLWRSAATGQGATPEAALEAAMAAVLPLAMGGS
jgi:hypothetical protein